MKIVHLATSLSGGAGIAARRIVSAQTENGLNSTLVSGQGEASDLNINEAILPKKLLGSLSSKALTVIQGTIVQNSSRLMTPVGLTQDVLASPIVKAADLLHFHAFYNLSSVSEILNISKNLPVAVTMHDQRFFTGGCHYSFSCINYQSMCIKCPQTRVVARKLPKWELSKNMKIRDKSNQIRLISPSKWLANIAKQSSLFSDFPIKVIRNPVPNEMFAGKLNRKKQKQEKIKIGFIAENLNNPYKGLQILVSALNQHDLSEKFDLHLFGKGEITYPITDLKITREFFSGEAGTRRAMESIDVLVVPSLQDNFPSVILEALACGVPVIGSDIGGIPEVLRDFGMSTFEAGNVSALSYTLKNYVWTQIDEGSLLKIRETFSYKTSFREHLEVYNSLLA